MYIDGNILSLLFFVPYIHVVMIDNVVMIYSLIPQEATSGCYSLYLAEFLMNYKSVEVQRKCLMIF